MQKFNSKEKKRKEEKDESFDNRTADRDPYPDSIVVETHSSTPLIRQSHRPFR